MSDLVKKIRNSYMQHGKENNRIYLMKLAPKDCPEILSDLDKIALDNEYSKIFAKVPYSLKQEFLEKGYQVEAQIPNFFRGKEDGIFMAKYFDEQRRQLENKDRIFQVLEVSLKKKFKEKNFLEKGYLCRKAQKEDTKEMAKVYQKVFESYPFPIEDPSYLKKTMEENIEYFGIWNQDQLVALSSSEMDLSLLNVEMTDFAILPDYRGKNLSLYLLNEMEKEMKKKRIQIAYSIARSHSFAMNTTFSKAGYDFRGTLIQNTQIAGHLESMNVWYKSLI
ncbi:putative beta-lysine N-acetyltransferase [Garciella nitratireducens]|uniref:putative beta-lysine N-acetyltransferase n=1 Tax=Garciella nitratireducens TaxID=218205 RepID=UPI001BD55DA7|nr:putative beta-lysine N-acetyltransferase [Garciella nitratireducens]